MGGTVICVSCWNQQDQCAYSYRKKDGIDLKALQSITDHFGEIDKNKAQDLGYELLSGDAWIEQNVDLLVPSALEYQITAENVEKINHRVKIIAEGANGPTTPDADKALENRGILIIPDFLANAGGVTCSYFEQIQSNANYYWRKDEVLGKLDVNMTGAYIDVSDFAKANNLYMRNAAYMISVDRVARACHSRGWV
jgi:glutamate dehydrogenase (NAD(P)+)